jgi:hypothetical protein
VGPTCQRAFAAWLPRARAAPLARLKGAVGTRRQLPDSRPDSAARCPSCAVASPHVRSSRLRRRPCPKPTDAVRARHRHCLDASAIVSSSTMSGARAPSCRVFFRGTLSLAPSPSSPSQDRRRPPEPSPRRRTPPPIRFFSPSPSTRSSGELSPPPPCLAGNLSAVGTRAPPFAPPLPPAAPRRRGPRRPRPAQQAVGHVHCAHGPNRCCGHGPRATMQLGRARFRPSGSRTSFLFSKYIQILVNLKICSGFI